MANKPDLHVGIFGPGLSGKTTLAKALSRAYSKQKIASIVLDINGEKGWGDCATVFTDEAEFWACVWASKSCMIFVDEAAETIARDNEKTALFTRVRHCGHKLHVMGHNATNLLPVHRQQLSTLYLFKQSPKSAAIWAEEMAEDRLKKAVNLEQYQFILWKNWEKDTCKIMKLAL